MEAIRTNHQRVEILRLGSKTLGPGGVCMYVKGGRGQTQTGTLEVPLRESEKERKRDKDRPRPSKR